MRAIFFSLLFLFLFIYFFLKRKELGLYVIIFSIPFSYTPFFTEKYGQYIPISITGILILVYYLLTFSRRKKKGESRYFKNLHKILIFLLIWGLVFAIIFHKDAINLYYYFLGELHTQLSKLHPIVQVLFHASNLVICIIFLKILKSHLQDAKNIKSSAYIFSLTMIPNFIFQLIQMTGNKDILGGIFIASDYSGINDPRFFGLFTIFGFGVYIAMIVAFSLYFKFKHYKKILIITVLYAIFSGQRQAIVDTGIVLSIYLLFSNIHVFKKIVYISIFSLIIYCLFFIYDDMFVSIYRLWDSIELIQNDEFLEATGRDVQRIPEIISALKNWPISGKGLYNWGYFIGINSYYADHVVIFNIYQKFGIVGFILFFSSILSFLIIVIKKLIRTNEKTKYSIFLSLILAFIVNQFIDNFFWFTNIMIMYIFMFGIMFSLMNYSQTNYNHQIAVK